MTLDTTALCMVWCLTSWLGCGLTLPPCSSWQSIETRNSWCGLPYSNWQNIETSHVWYSLLEVSIIGMTVLALDKATVPQKIALAHDDTTESRPPWPSWWDNKPLWRDSTATSDLKNDIDCSAFNCLSKLGHLAVLPMIRQVDFGTSTAPIETSHALPVQSDLKWECWAHSNTLPRSLLESTCTSTLLAPARYAGTE
jgi:hypothetical protein